MIYLIGGRGFVGSGYARLFEREGLQFEILNGENFALFDGTSCEVLINANGNSKKFLAEREPLWDFEASVSTVASSLYTIQAERYVFLSTGDVYPRQDEPGITREADTFDPAEMSRYGMHKFLAETLVRANHKQHLVVRMGGFVGPGLKKNAIFDMLNGAPVWLHPDSELQFISTDSAARIVWSLVEKGIVNETINLGARGVVRIGDVYEEIGSKSEFQPEARKIRFEISTDKLASLYPGELPTSRQEVSAFLNAAKP